MTAREKGPVLRSLSSPFRQVEPALPAARVLSRLRSEAGLGRGAEGPAVAPASRHPHPGCTCAPSAQLG